MKSSRIKETETEMSRPPHGPGRLSELYSSNIDANAEVVKKLNVSNKYRIFSFEQKWRKIYFENNKI